MKNLFTALAIAGVFFCSTAFAQAPAGTTTAATNSDAPRETVCTTLEQCCPASLGSGVADCGMRFFQRQAVGMSERVNLLAEYIRTLPPSCQPGATTDVARLLAGHPAVTKNAPGKAPPSRDHRRNQPATAVAAGPCPGRCSAEQQRRDADCDGVADLGPDGTALDNCPGVCNPGQDDEDADHRGNACDPADDRVAGLLDRVTGLEQRALTPEFAAELRQIADEVRAGRGSYEVLAARLNALDAALADHEARISRLERLRVARSFWASAEGNLYGTGDANGGLAVGVRLLQKGHYALTTVVGLGLAGELADRRFAFRFALGTEFILGKPAATVQGSVFVGASYDHAAAANREGLYDLVGFSVEPAILVGDANTDGSGTFFRIAVRLGVGDMRTPNGNALRGVVGPNAGVLLAF